LRIVTSLRLYPAKSDWRSRIAEEIQYRINNLAYVRDRKLAAWFLERAFGILKGWPREKQEWMGDQEAWQAALEPSLSPTAWPISKTSAMHHLVSRLEDKEIHLYPCYTHNCFMSDSGRIMPHYGDAYFMHLKGPRKEHLSKWMEQRFGV
jgi:hypothetical protein